MRVLGIEGTAWCASAALYDAETDSVLIESNPYEPDSGGIHPREAAEHMSEAIPEVVDAVLHHGCPSMVPTQSMRSRSREGRDSARVSASSGPPLGRSRGRSTYPSSASITWWRT